MNPKDCIGCKFCTKDVVKRNVCILDGRPSIWVEHCPYGEQMSLFPEVARPQFGFREEAHA